MGHLLFALARATMVGTTKSNARWQAGKGETVAYGKRIAERIEFQGSLVKACFKGAVTDAGTNRGDRAEITEFSSRSRRSLMELQARLNQHGQMVSGKWCSVKYLTLTTRAVYGPRTFKAFMRAWLERLRRAYPSASAIWKIEPQSRGACHAHLMIYGMPYVKQSVLRQWWCEVISGDGGAHIKALNGGKKQIVYYVSKYVAKVQSTSFIEGSNPHAGTCEEMRQWQSPGRFWGVHNRTCLPFAPLIVFAHKKTRAFWQFRRTAARRSRHVLRGGGGFALFVDDAQQWLRCLIQYDHQWPEKPYVRLSEHERRTWGQCYDRQSTVSAPTPAPPHSSGSGGVRAWIAREQD